MLKILHVMGCSDAGGVSSVVRNYYQFIDKTQVHFDIALTIEEQGQNSRALEAMGAKIFFLPLKSRDPSGFRRELSRLLTEGRYDGLHVHESETCFVALKIARELNIPCRIAHAHTTSPYEGIPSIFRRWAGCLLNCRYASHVIGCGQLAGERIFGKRNMKTEKAVVLPNAVDTGKFAFSARVRQEVRRELGVEDNLVLGMVARLSEQKNVPFALDLMAALREKLPKARLLIAGNGEEEEAVRRRIRELSLEDRVILLGRRSDAERLYQAFDLLLLPSLSEGFPVAAVEGLASGLPVILSDRITGELSCFSGVRYLPIRDVTPWVQAAEAFQEDGQREKRQQEVRKYGLDIRDCAGKLLQIYEQDAGRTR